MIGLDEGCSSARMSRYENGVHEPPFPIIESIAKLLKVPVAYFFCEDDRLAEIMRKVITELRFHVPCILEEATSQQVDVLEFGGCDGALRVFVGGFESG